MSYYSSSEVLDGPTDAFGGAGAVVAPQRFRPRRPHRKEQYDAPLPPPISLAEARRIAQMEIDYVPNPAFAEMVVCDEAGEEASRAAAPAGNGKVRGYDGAPANVARLCEAEVLSPEEERERFRRMNFLKFRAARLQRGLCAHDPDRRTAHQIALLLERAEQIRNSLVEANTRLLVSIVKHFVGGRFSFDDLLSEGAMSLLRAVEKFDYDRGFRFSTYATQVIRRSIYRFVGRQAARDAHLTSVSRQVAAELPAPERPDQYDVETWTAMSPLLQAMAQRLDRREHAIILARFGFTDDGQSHTLQSLADQLGVCKERIRQLEQRAMRKLRELAREFDLPAPTA